MFRANAWPHDAPWIVFYLKNRSMAIHDRDAYLDRLLKSEICHAEVISALKNISAEIEDIKSKKEPDQSTLSSLYLLRRAHNDIRSALDRLNPTIESICKYLESTEREIADKDHYLDTLMLSSNTKKLVFATIARVKAEINYLTHLLGVNILNNGNSAEDPLEIELRTARYVFCYLDSALDRNTPTSRGLYLYLANAERTDETKLAHLKKLSESKSGLYLINIMSKQLQSGHQSFFNDRNGSLKSYETESLGLNVYEQLSHTEVVAIIKHFNDSRVPPQPEVNAKMSKSRN